MSQEKQLSNEFRIGIKSSPKYVITQCEKLLKEDKSKEIQLSAVGHSIGELTIISEILKSMIPQLSKKMLFSVISSKPSEKDKKIENKTRRLYPRLEIVLSVDEKDKEDSPIKITEEERTLLIETLEKQKEYYRKSRKSRRPLRNRRRWKNYSRKPRYQNSIRRNSYNKKKIAYNRRPFGKSPNGRRSNVKKTNGSRKNSGNKPASPVKN